MKKAIGKILKGVGVGALCLTLSVPVISFAASSSKSVTGYGTLYGYLSTSTIRTTVSKNNDNAYLTIKAEAQTSAGSTIIVSSQLNSSRGATSKAGSFTFTPASGYALYGTHGVQGGSTYGAAAVYTVTHY